MSSKTRIDRNAKIDSQNRLKDSMSMLTARAAKVSKPKVGEVIEVPLSDIQVAEQVRTHADEIQTLMESIKEEGQRSPIEVYFNEDDQLALLSGERRFRSLEALGVDKAKAIVVKTPTGVADKIFRQLSENEERESLTAMDRGRAYSQLSQAGLTQRDIAERVHKSRSAVRRHIVLYEAPEAIKAAYHQGIVSDLMAVEMMIQAFERYPDDFLEFLDSVQEEGTIGRGTLENWLEWRESNTPISPVTATLDADEREDIEQEAENVLMRTKTHPATTATPTPASVEAPEGKRAGTERSETGLKIPERSESHTPEGQQASEKAQKVPEPEKTQASASTKRASPAQQVLASHYQGQPETVSPHNIYIEVSAKLLDGKTKVEGKLLVDRVDQDRSWAWIITHDEGKEMRVKAKTLKIKGVTG